MRRILLSGLFLLFPAVANAQAQGGPEPPKTDAAKPAAKPTEAKPAEKPAEAKPAEAPKAAEAPKNKAVTSAKAKG